MTSQQARKLAEETIAILEMNGDGELVAYTTFVGLDDDGYWVADNGEFVVGLDRAHAIEIIVENLSA